METDGNHFYKVLKETRDLIAASKYKEAFKHIVDLPTSNLKELLNKISALLDAGYILRDENILKYGIYLLETHRDEITVVREYAPLILASLADQYANMAALYSYHDDYEQFYKRSELTGAKDYYKNALKIGIRDQKLKERVLLNLGYTLLNCGRGWEALHFFQELLVLQPNHIDALLKKAEILISYSPLNKNNRDILYREVWHLLLKVEELEGAESRSDQIKSLRDYLVKVCSLSFLDDEEEYPTLSVETENDSELSFIEFCIQKRLYNNICVFCRKCDFAIGDRSIIDAKNVTLTGRGKKRYYNLAYQLNLIKEEYITGRYLLAHSRDEKYDFSYAELNFETVDLEHFQHSSLNESLLKKSFSSGWELIDAITVFLQIYLEEKIDSNIRPETLWMVKDSVKSEIRKNRNPSLHALFDIYCDLFNGSDSYFSDLYKLIHAQYTEHTLLSPQQKKLTSLNLHDETVSLYQILNNMIIYLMMLMEEESDPVRKVKQDYPFYSFTVPDDLLIKTD